MKEYDKITRNGGKLSPSIEIGNFILVGEYNYKGFAINNLLMPELVNMAYQFSAADGTSIEKKELKSQVLKIGKPLVKFTQNDTLHATSYKINLTNINLDFSKENLKKFDDYINLVDGYYNADAHLAMLETELAKVRTDTLELLELFRQQTIDNIAAINKIKAERYQSKLDLDTHDPIGLISHLGKNRTEK